MLRISIHNCEILAINVCVRDKRLKDNRKGTEGNIHGTDDLGGNYFSDKGQIFPQPDIHHTPSRHDTSPPSQPPTSPRNIPPPIEPLTSSPPSETLPSPPSDTLVGDPKGYNVDPCCKGQIGAKGDSLESGNEMGWEVAKERERGGSLEEPPGGEGSIPEGGRKYERWWGRQGTALEPTPGEGSRTPGSHPGRESAERHPTERKLASPQRKDQTPHTLERTIRAESPSAETLETEEEA
jgi:hypothetical protein